MNWTATFPHKLVRKWDSLRIAVMRSILPALIVLLVLNVLPALLGMAIYGIYVGVACCISMVLLVRIVRIILIFNDKD